MEKCVVFLLLTFTIVKSSYSFSGVLAKVALRLSYIIFVVFNLFSAIVLDQ